MNGHFMGFRQLVQKLERITPIISTLQDKQNEWSFCRFSKIGSKARKNKTDHLYSFEISEMMGHCRDFRSLTVQNLDIRGFCKFAFKTRMKFFRRPYLTLFKY